ncbi:MAG: nucleoside hydrolase, partial [Corynebacteriales bacterium]|nr:nucleoside hydrolase [Mycobacteriales bacterium]
MSRYDEEEHLSAPADDVHPNEVWAGWINEGKRPGSPLAAFAAQWEKKGSPLRQPLSELPMIIDTDIGDDPDDTFAIIAAARAVKNLTLVATCDEQDGRRASLARHVLSLVGRDEVSVVAGKELGNATSLSGLAIPSFEAPTDLVARVVSVAERTPGDICWLGLGPMSNLATLLRECPELAPRIRLIQMGGALKLGRSEHNIRLDVPAAQFVLSRVIRPKFVLLDTTAHEENALTEIH